MFKRNCNRLKKATEPKYLLTLDDKLLPLDEKAILALGITRIGHMGSSKGEQLARLQEEESDLTMEKWAEREARKTQRKS